MRTEPTICIPFHKPEPIHVCTLVIPTKAYILDENKVTDFEIFYKNTFILESSHVINSLNESEIGKSNKQHKNIFNKKRQ